ncbi:alpha/beta fold hydrolase [Liquorilactobacillus mali]|uniref:Halo peroxidase n=1 Tax=Liquorilactobacillus mali TaxID=1618 RepID=A0A0R2FMV9_9LACO|nr:alpha/beta hydrolase [Liquorilactobacillus mali]KRN26583.1 halo peroxidase [Liquorilactobacillus mali]
MCFQTSDKINLSYNDIGAGQPILILTGLGGSKEIWHAQIPILINAGFRVINLDCRNQGESQTTTKGLRISRHAIDIHELIVLLNLKNVIFLGNSMGASTFWAYFSIFGEGNVAGMVDIDQSPKMINDSNWNYGFKNVTWKDFPQYFDNPLTHSTYKHIDNDTFKLIKEISKKHPYNYQLSLPFLIDHVFQDWRDIICQMTIPFLIIAGEKSPYFDSKFAAIVAKMSKNGSAVVVKNAGHIVMAEQSTITNKILTTFLKKYK